MRAAMVDMLLLWRPAAMEIVHVVQCMRTSVHDNNNNHNNNGNNRRCQIDGHNVCDYWACGMQVACATLLSPPSSKSSNWRRICVTRFQIVAVYFNTGTHIGQNSSLDYFANRYLWMIGLPKKAIYVCAFRAAGMRRTKVALKECLFFCLLLLLLFLSSFLSSFCRLQRVPLRAYLLFSIFNLSLLYFSVWFFFCLLFIHILYIPMELQRLNYFFFHFGLSVCIAFWCGAVR